MKFRRKPAAVEVGIMTRESMHGGLLDPNAPPILGVTTESGQTFCLPFERFVDEYEPADGDAEVWFSGLQARAAERARRALHPFGHPPAPEPPMGGIEGLEIRDNDGNVVQQMRFIQPDKDKPGKRKTQ